MQLFNFLNRKYNNEFILSSRYNNDSIPLFPLNKIQYETKKNIEVKLKDNIYSFEKVNCIICKKNRFTDLSNKDRYGLHFPVVICNACGLVQTNPRMNQKSYSEFYKLEYRKLYGGKGIPTDHFFQSQYEKGKNIYNFIKSLGFLKKPKGMFILEVGCGSGGILKYFRDQGCIIKGIDLGQKYLDYGIEKYNLDLELGTIESISLQKKPDLIIYADVLEHILNPDRELLKIHNLLANEGMFYIGLPGIKNIYNSKFYKGDFLRYLQNAHVYHFTLKTLNNLLLNNGFKLLFGNEVINSIYKKDKFKKATLKNDFFKVTQYIKQIEKKRVKKESRSTAHMIINSLTKLNIKFCLGGKSLLGFYNKDVTKYSKNRIYYIFNISDKQIIKLKKILSSKRLSLNIKKNGKFVELYVKRKRFLKVFDGYRDNVKYHLHISRENDKHFLFKVNKKNVEFQKEDLIPNQFNLVSYNKSDLKIPLPNNINQFINKYKNQL